MSSGVPGVFPACGAALSEFVARVSGAWGNDDLEPWGWLFGFVPLRSQPDRVAQFRAAIWDSQLIHESTFDSLLFMYTMNQIILN